MYWQCWSSEKHFCPLQTSRLLEHTHTHTNRALRPDFIFLSQTCAGWTSCTHCAHLNPQPDKSSPQIHTYMLKILTHTLCNSGLLLFSCPAHSTTWTVFLLCVVLQVECLRLPSDFTPRWPTHRRWIKESKGRRRNQREKQIRERLKIL